MLQGEDCRGHKDCRLLAIARRLKRRTDSHLGLAEALCLRADMTFDVSIMQMASVVHVWGGTGGTYSVDGENITFTYDILSTEGEVVAADDVMEGTDFTETTLSVGFNISQATMRASASPFIRVNE